MKSNGHLETDALIIGGGIAGLTTAVGLLDHGLEPVVVERSSILGGRASSWKDEKTGDPIHIGPHIFMSEYPNMLKLMGILGTRDKLVWEEDQLIKVIEGNREIIGRMWKAPAPLHFLPSFFADDVTPLFDKLSSVPLALYAMRVSEEDILRLDAVNGYAFLRSMGVSDVHIERFWDPTSMYIMNTPVNMVSAGALMRFFKFLIGRSDYKIGFPDGGLGDTYAPAAREYIEARGGKILMETTVESLIQDGADRVAGVVLSDGRRVLAKRVVIAAPPKAVLKLLPHPWVKAHGVFQDLTWFHEIPYIAVYIWFDKKLSKGKFWARLYKPGDFNSDFYDLSNINRGWAERPSVITSNIIFSSRLANVSDETIVERTVEEIAEYHPIVREAKVLHSVVNRIPMAVHVPYPGTERRRPANRTPIKGLYLAGDWTRTQIPACMESAAKSGWMTVESILADLGRPTELALEHGEPEGIAGVVSRISNALPFRGTPRWVRQMGRVIAP